MPSPIEIALSQLLPTVNFIDEDLLSLAHSLLSQSRAKAASLKPEEEIGRTYVCAHIACERLKKKLDLEIDKPKPPCPPRVYKKLYTYLDGALANPQTPKSARKRDAWTNNSASQGTNDTPTRAVAAQEVEVKTPTTATRRSREERPTTEDDGARGDTAPIFAMPMIRAICKATNTPKAAPHILVGAGAVNHEIASRVQKRAKDSGPPSKRKRTQITHSIKVSDNAHGLTGLAQQQWPACLVTLHALVVARMRGVDVNDEQTRMDRIHAIHALREHAPTHGSTLPLSLPKRIHSPAFKDDVDFYFLEAEDCGWMDMEWYQNIPESSPDADAEEGGEGKEGEDSEDEGPFAPRTRPSKTPLRRKEKRGGKAAAAALDQEEEGAAGLLPGLGTMFQTSVDWLSDERQAEYGQWKRKILAEALAVERTGIEA